MFLIDTENDIADFLEAVNFLPPEGFTVDYFVVPQNEMQVPANTGFELLSEDDLSQTYCRVEPINKIDQADSPIEYSDWSVPHIGVKGAKKMPLPRSVDPSELRCPFVKELSESNSTYKDLLLNKRYGPFPKGTVFHCVRKSSLLKEAYSSKNLSKKDAANLVNISTNSLNAVTYLISVTNHFLQTLETYKESLSDNIDLSSESLDIATKYSKNNSSGQVHTLPGIISTPAQYNITELKADHDRLQMLKTETDKAKSEADIYMRLLSEDVSIMLKYWKKINSNNALFEQLIEVLNSSIPGPY